MDIRITIAPEDAPTVVAAIARRHNYREQLDTPTKDDPKAKTPNPESREQFVKRWLINCLKNEVSLDLIQQEQNAAQERVRAGLKELDIT